MWFSGSINVWTMQRLAWIQDLCMSSIQWHEYLTKLPVSEPTIVIYIIPLEEQIDLILWGDDTECLHQTLEQLSLRDATPPHRVKDSKHIIGVEVRVLHHIYFGLLDKPLLIDELHEDIQEVVLYLITDQWLVHILHKCGLFAPRFQCL